MTTVSGPDAWVSAQRCAPWTRGQGVDPIGSAGSYDAFLLVESPQPWPDDVSSIPALADAAARDRRTRVLAVVPRADDDSGLVRVVQWRRTSSAAFTGTDYRIDTAQVPELLAALIDHPDGAHPGRAGPAPPEVLLCAHGRRDACCGRFGTLLSVEVAARWEGVRTWRCSHTGGHRFAPTGLTFPDGRAWAFLDAATLDGIVARTADAADVLSTHYRGTTALDTWGQVVERELFLRFGWAWLDHVLTATTTEVAPDGRSARVNLRWDGPTGPGGAEGQVVVSRDVPVLICGLPPDQAVKTSPELALDGLHLQPG